MRYIITLVFAFIIFYSKAQTECINEVSTNPVHPSNNSLPPLSNGSDNLFYLNGLNVNQVFDAPGTGWDGLWKGYETSNMFFAGIPLPIMKNINVESGTLPYYDYLFDGPKPLTENGWELLLVNLGRFPNDNDEIPVAAANLHQFPYIVIYNKYLGKIRVFCKFGLDQTVFEAADAVEISLQYTDPKKVSGAMRLYEGMNQSLDMKTDIVMITSVAKAQNFGNTWYSTDFQIAYDPCTCFYPSEIKLLFSQIKEQDLVAHSRTVTLEDQPLIDNDLVVKPTDWLSGFDYSGETVEGGLAMAKSLDVMIERYIAELEQYKIDYANVVAENKEVNKRLAVMKLFDKVVLKGAGQLVSNFLAFDFWGDIEENAKELLGKDSTDNDVIDKKALEKMGKKFLASGVSGLKTLITGEIKPLPEEPNMPTATFSETSYSGKITSRSDYAGPKFYTPGTYGSSGTGRPVIGEVYNYPVYNEVLGTFALLKKPKLEIGEFLFFGENKVFQKTSQTIINVKNLGLQRYQSWTKAYKFGLAEKLEFAFNDVLDIKDYNIDVSFVIKAKRKNLDIPSTSIISGFHDSGKFVNTLITNDNIENFNPIYSKGMAYRYYYDNPIVELADWDPNNVTSLTDKREFHFETPFIPIDAMMPFENSIGIKNEAVSFRFEQINDQELENIDYEIINNQYVFDLSDPGITKPEYLNPIETGFEYVFEIEMRLLIDIEFNDVDEFGNPHVATEIHTYKIDPSWISNGDWASYPKDITQYQENLNFHDINFNGEQVDGCSLSNKTYTCRAWYDIKIDGDLTTSNNYSANLIAGNLVTVVPEANVNPEISYWIEPILDYSQPMPKATLAQVKDFCDGNLNVAGSYLANISSKSSIIDTLSYNDNLNKGINNVDYSVSLFPNPAGNRVTVQLSSLVEGTRIIIVDMMGRTIPVEISQEGRSYQIALDHLQSGSYMVRVVNTEGTINKRLIKK